MSVTQTFDDETATDVGLHGEYIPSPEEIRRQCAEIRRSWSEKERQSRSSQRNARWVVPVFKVGNWF